MSGPVFPLAELIGWVLLHSLWQGLLLALGLAALLRLIPARLAGWRYASACLALLALPLWMGLTAWQLQPGFGALPPATLARDFVSVEGSRLLTLLAPLAPYLTVAWLLGVALQGLGLAGGWRYLQSVRRAAVPAPDAWQERLLELGRGLGLERPVGLLVSARLETPMVVGVLRPVVLLPLSALLGLSARQLELILLHELAHIRRHDALVNLLQSVIEVLCFYHPAVWWLASALRQEREHCCDDAAVRVSGQALAYSQALAALETLRPARRQVALSATGGHLMKRIRRLVHLEFPVRVENPQPLTSHNTQDFRPEIYPDSERIAETSSRVSATRRGSSATGNSRSSFPSFPTRECLWKLDLDSNSR